MGVFSTAGVRDPKFVGFSAAVGGIRFVNDKMSTVATFASFAVGAAVDCGSFTFASGFCLNRFNESLVGSGVLSFIAGKTGTLRRAVLSGSACFLLVTR